MGQKYRPVPPPAPKAIELEDVPRIDALKQLGVTQKAIGRNLGIHWRTVHNILHRKGAYKDVPK